MEKELIEQVAKAIWKERWRYTDERHDDYQTLLDSYWTNHIDEAKSAITAMASFSSAKAIVTD